MQGDIFIYTAKEYLKQIKRQKKLIRQLEDTVGSLRANLSKIGCGYKTDKVQSSPKKDTIPDAVATVLDMESNIEVRISKLNRLQQDIIRQIANIPDYILQAVLMARYITGKSWEDISIDMSYSMPHLYKLHNTAIREFARCNQKFLEELHKDDSF